MLLVRVVLQAASNPIIGRENRRIVLRRICTISLNQGLVARKLEPVCKKLAHATLQIISRGKGIASLDESNMTTVKWKLDFQVRVASSPLAHLVKNLRGQKRVVNRA